MANFLKAVFFFQISAVFASAATSFLAVNERISKEKDYPKIVEFSREKVLPRISALAFDGDNLLSAFDGKIAVWDAKGGALKKVFSPKKKIGDILGLKPLGKNIFACGGIAGESGTLSKLDFEGNADIISKSGDVFSSMDSGGKFLAAGSLDGKVVVIDVSSGEKVLEKKFEGLRVKGVSLSEGGEVLSVSLSDGSARIALAKDKFSNEVEQVSSGGAPCSLSPDGKFVAHVERDKNGNYACILQPLFSENPRKARSSVSGPSEVVFDMKRLLLFPQSGNPLARPFRYFGRIGQDAAGGGEVGDKFPNNYRSVSGDGGVYSFAVGGNVFAVGSDDGKILLWPKRRSEQVALYSILDSECKKWGVSVFNGYAFSNSPNSVAWKTRDGSKFSKEDRFFSAERVKSILSRNFEPGKHRKSFAKKQKKNG